MPPCVRGAIGPRTINHRGPRVAFTFARTRTSAISQRWLFFRPGPEALALAMLAATPGGATARAAAVSEPAGCRAVRLADVGWTDVTATTAVLSALLRDLGYDAHTTLLSVPVTFASMKRGNIDVFLGNWMPAQTNDRRPYLEDRSIEVVRENLSGAKYTLAVPAYTYAAGLRDFADIQRFGAALHHTIYGIEAGNDGNHHILRMIQNNDFGLGFPAARVERARHARGGGAGLCRTRADRVPGLGSAPDEHPVRSALSRGRGFGVWAELRGRLGADAHPRRLSRTMPECRAPAAESAVHDRCRERDHARDGGRRAAAGGRRARVAPRSSDDGRILAARGRSVWRPHGR